MRTLPEVQELLEEIERELSRLQGPLADAAEQYELTNGRAEAAMDASIDAWDGPGWKAKHSAATENSADVTAAYKAKARLAKGKMVLAVMDKRLEALRSANAGLTAEMKMTGAGYST